MRYTNVIMLIAYIATCIERHGSLLLFLMSMIVV